MASEQQDIKPLQSGFPPLHLLSAVTSVSGTSVASPIVAGTSAVPMSIIPVFQPNMFAPGVIGLPFTLNQQALLQANYAAATACSSGKTSAIAEALQQGTLSPDSSKTIKLPLKRKYSEDDNQTKMGLAEALVHAQPRTNKGKVYSWMQSGHPKRQRAKITDVLKKEILQFCKNHTLLKQGEIADIYGVDRTTVTKMLKRSQENPGSEESYDPTRQCQEPQFEIEDMLYRWINNATRHNPPNQPVWSCEQLLEQAHELQNLTEKGDSFHLDLQWLYDFVERFRIKRLLTDCKLKCVHTFRESRPNTRFFCIPKSIGYLVISLKF